MRDKEKRRVREAQYHQIKKNDPEYRQRRNENRKKWMAEKRKDPAFLAKAHAYQSAWMKKKRSTDPHYKKYGVTATRTWQKANPVWAMRIAYTSRCKRKHIEFRLSHDQFERLLQEECFYCGEAPNPLNTIDRIDSKHGYFIGNVVTACNECNRAKLDRPLLQFEEWIIKVYNHYFKSMVIND